MDKKDLTFSNYLSDIRPDFVEVVTGIHDYLTGLGCQVSLQEAKSGHVVSFRDPATKKTVANFVSRKSGPVVRIYGDNAVKYVDYLETLPEPLGKKIAGSSVCRRLVDPTKCNSRCPMGYDLTFRGERIQKCRHSCFMFPITADTAPCIREIVERELKERAAS